MKSLLIFDLDGTLADSKSDLCASVNYVRRRYELPPLSEAEIAVMIGSGATALIQRALKGAIVEGRIEDGVGMFLDYYREHMLDQTRLYPGVQMALDELSGCTLAVLTNKPYRFSCRLLEGLGIYDRFSFVYGGNSFNQKKPNPVGIIKILAETKARSSVTWMVGDSAVDVQTGRAAGVRTCGVTYGYAPQTFDDDPPDCMIDDFQQLPDLILNKR